MKKRSLPVLLLLLGLAAGCATEPLYKQEPPIAFPPPPSEPRIVYERSIHGPLDFIRLTWIDRLFGATIPRGFGKPFDVFVSGDRVFVTDTEFKLVHVLDYKANKAFNLGTVGTGRLVLPLGVRGTPDGKIYVSDAKQKAVFVYDAEGRHLQTIGAQAELVNPAGIAIDYERDRLYVADSKGQAVKVFSLQGEFLSTIGQAGGGDADGMFLNPSFLTVDRKTGSVFVSDTNNFRVQVFDKDGKFLRKFGELGDAPGYFQRPKGIGIDSEGNDYVVEGVFNNFQIFNDQGQILTWIGWGGSRAGGLFQNPSGLYVDENDKVYVVDTENNRVQVFQYLSESFKRGHPELYEKYKSR